MDKFRVLPMKSPNIRRNFQQKSELLEIQAPNLWMSATPPTQLLQITADADLAKKIMK